MNSKDFISGLKAGTPVLMGYVPVGIAYGMMGIQAGLSVPEVCSLSLFVYTGAGQMTAASMIALKASAAAIIATVFLLNLRHIIMSTVVMDRLRKTPLTARLLLAFGVTDEVFAVFVMEDTKNPSGWYFFGLGLISWAGWNFGSLLGALSSSLFPPVLSASLNITLYALFAALLVPGMKKSLRITLLVLQTCVLSWAFSRLFSSSYSVLISMLVSAMLGLFYVRKEDLE